jgi:hypothetical protein
VSHPAGGRGAARCGRDTIATRASSIPSNTPQLFRFTAHPFLGSRNISAQCVITLIRLRLIEIGAARQSGSLPPPASASARGRYPACAARQPNANGKRSHEYELLVGKRRGSWRTTPSSMVAHLRLVSQTNIVSQRVQRPSAQCREAAGACHASVETETLTPTLK